MTVEVDLTEIDLQKLRHFHQAHFPNQAVPAIANTPHDARAEHTEKISESDGLGYYADGTRRTLTDDQIAMFRHSEIQRHLKQRRKAQEREERDAVRAKRLEAKRAKESNERGIAPRYRTDEHVHSTEQVNELAYDEEAPRDKDQELKVFHWPTLRA